MTKHHQNRRNAKYEIVSYPAEFLAEPFTFPGGIKALDFRVTRALINTFATEGFLAFDINIDEKPFSISDDLRTFLGGYSVDFKLIPHTHAAELGRDLDEMRRRAIAIGQGTKFLIDISKFEYIEEKTIADVDGFQIYVYSPEMIVCEKLRALCQQMPEYGDVVNRSRPGGARARDFYDIFCLVDFLKLNFEADTNRLILVEMFKVKRVPLELLSKIEAFREFHRTDFQRVVATVRPGVEIKDFDFYFNFVTDLVKSLQTRWDI